MIHVTIITDKQVFIRELERELLEKKLLSERLKAYPLSYYNNSLITKASAIVDCFNDIANIRKQINRVECSVP